CCALPRSRPSSPFSPSHAPRSHAVLSFNPTATTAIHTLSLHDALPISQATRPYSLEALTVAVDAEEARRLQEEWEARGIEVPLKDRKSTRLNSSHVKISYAVFCLKKKKKTQNCRTDASRTMNSAGVSSR